MQKRKTNNNKVYVPDYRDYDLSDYLIMPI